MTEKEVAAESSNVNNKSHWVTVMLDRKDPEASVKYCDELKAVFLPFVGMRYQLMNNVKHN